MEKREVDARACKECRHWCIPREIKWIEEIEEEVIGRAHAHVLGIGIGKDMTANGREGREIDVIENEEKELKKEIPKEKGIIFIYSLS